MSAGEGGPAAGGDVPRGVGSAAGGDGGEWPLWEVFTQPGDGRPHEHAGSLHAPDSEIALQNARDTYARRGEAVSIWVVPTEAVTASRPEDAGPFFDPADDKPYRHPQFYSAPRAVKKRA